MRSNLAWRFLDDDDDLDRFATGPRSGSNKALCKDLYFLANGINVIASLGYLLADFGVGYLGIPLEDEDFFFIALAVAYVIDALLYLWLWKQDEDPRKWGCAHFPHWLKFR